MRILGIPIWKTWVWSLGGSRKTSFYQVGGGGRWVLQVTPSFWQFGYVVPKGGCYQHLLIGPFILAHAVKKSHAYNH